MKKMVGWKQEETKQMVSLGFGGLGVWFGLVWFVVDDDVLFGWLVVLLVFI